MIKHAKRCGMILEYINAALEKAKYEIIEDDEPYYGEVPELKGVWATGKTLEECRKNLAETIEGWIILRLKKGLPLPSIGGIKFEEPKVMESLDKIDAGLMETAS
jgi:predicted RNase H-like HicB family nuclease